MTRPTTDELQARLISHFPDAQIVVTDESHLHAGHAGAQGGAGHFRVAIGSAHFAAITTVARHRLVYDAVREWMPDRIHALAIEARVIAPGDAAPART